MSAVLGVVPIVFIVALVAGPILFCVSSIALSSSAAGYYGVSVPIYRVKNYKSDEPCGEDYTYTGIAIDITPTSYGDI